MDKIKNISIVILIAIAMWLYIVTLNPVKPQIITVDSVITKVDTFVTYIQHPPETITERIFIHDTIYVSPAGDTTITEVATLDTSFEDGAELGVSYYITPSVYSIRYTPAPIKTQTIELMNTIYVDSSNVAWWDNWKIGAVSGFVGSILVVSLVR